MPYAKSKQLGVPHVFSVRDGDHGSHVVPQFEQKILPFFYLGIGASRFLAILATM